MQTFYDLLVELCSYKNITLKEMCIKTNISYGNVFLWRKGSKPKSETLTKIVKFFNVDDKYFQKSLEFDNGYKIQVDNNTTFADEVQKICDTLNVDYYKMLSELGIQLADMQEWSYSRKNHFRILLIANYLEIDPQEIFEISEIKQKPISIFYQRVQSLCESLGYTISGYLESIGITSSTVSTWRDRNPRLDNILLLAKTFNCTTDYLLGVDYDKSNYKSIVISRLEELDQIELQNVYEFLDFLEYKRKHEIEDVDCIHHNILVLDRHKDIIEMRKSGMTITQIADVKHVTKQNISRILKMYE